MKPSVESAPDPLPIFLDSKCGFYRIDSILAITAQSHHRPARVVFQNGIILEITELEYGRITAALLSCPQFLTHPARKSTHDDDI